jgi:hypothetical protein
LPSLNDAPLPFLPYLAAILALLPLGAYFFTQDVQNVAVWALPSCLGLAVVMRMKDEQEVERKLKELEALRYRLKGA